ncbi:MAG: hypothetical protein J6U14_09780 [Bacteroidaceae bacterium]|nr:hypothetical protein [Bacteroidaceae bacterium]
MKNNSKLLVSLLCVGMMTLAGCQNDDFIEKANPQRAAQKGATGDTWSLSIEATKGGSADTRALVIEEEEGKPDNLDGVWMENEAIGVYLKGVKLGTFYVTEINDDYGKSARLYGENMSEDGMEEGDNVLTLIYPDNETNPWSYTGQDGKLYTISDSYDYMLATLTVNFSEGVVTPSQSPIDFAIQQSIYRFGFKNGSDAIKVKEFTISSAANKIIQKRTLDNTDTWTSSYGPLTVTTSPTTDLLYVSILNELAGTSSATDTYNFTVVDDNNALYMGTKVIGEYFLADKYQFNSFKNVATSKATIDKKTGESNVVW